MEVVIVGCSQGDDHAACCAARDWGKALLKVLTLLHVVPLNDKVYFEFAEEVRRVVSFDLVV
jgi:hypothetical protein